MIRLFVAALSVLVFSSGARAQDVCATAVALPSGAQLGVVTSTSGLSISGVNPSCGGSAPQDGWYSWSPDFSAAGDWHFTTCNNADYDTRLALYDACAGTELGCNDDHPSCTGFESQLFVAGLVDSATYYLQVGGFNDASGMSTMDIDFHAAPPVITNDTCGTAIALAVPSLTPYDTTLATQSGTMNSCSPHNPLDIWYSFTTGPAGGTHVLSLCGSSYDTRLTLWDACGGNELFCSDSDCGLQSEISATGLAGNTTYYVQVAGYHFTSNGPGTLDIFATGIATPPNDDCANATPLASGATSVFVDTTGAGPSGLTSSCLSGAPNDVFYEWSPDVDGIWVFTTSGSTFPARVSLKPTCGPGQVQCGIGNPDVDLQLINPILAANTYLIMISGPGTETGTLTLDIAPFIPPGGDECATANVRPPGAQSLAFDTTPATNSGQLPSCGGGFIFDIWYEWSPNASGDWRFSTCNMATFDTRLALWASCAGPELGCNDDGVTCSTFTSALTVNGLSSSASYFIQVGGFSTHEGTGTLDITQVGGPAPIGSNYCPLTPNSNGAGATLGASGSNSVSANNLVLSVSNASSSEPGVFFYGTSQIQAPFGEGNRCAGGTVVRLWPPSFAGASGSNSIVVDNTASVSASSPAPVVTGASLNFQYWFRDPLCADCDGDLNASGFNLSDAYRIVFQP